MLIGDILYSVFTALINTIVTTPFFSFLNNLFGIPFRLAGV